MHDVGLIGCVMRDSQLQHTDALLLDFPIYTLQTLAYYCQLGKILNWDIT
jgi:hypothetical protein